MSWGWGGGGRRPRGWYGGGGYGGGPWNRGGGYGRGPWGGGPYQRGGGGGCLRDLLLVETGCCLAEALGCGPQLLLVAPRVLRASSGTAGDSWALRLVRAYRSEIRPRRRRPCCRMEPSCSTYAEEALLRHGTRRGLLLTARRLLRCRPGGPRGYDPVP